MKQSFTSNWTSRFAGLLCLFGASYTMASPTYSQIVAFGDSLSDVGNVAILTETLGGTLQPSFFDPSDYPDLVPDTAYAESRKLTNDGPIWLETVASRQGLPVFPSAAGGGVYAFGGANSTDELGPLVPPETLIPSVSEQVSEFLGDVGGVAPVDALYTLTVGGNDLRDAFTYATSFADITDIFERSISAVVSLIAALGAAGAQDIVLFNVPNLGLVPQITLLDSLGVVDAAAVSTLTAAYNDSLAAALSAQLASLGMDLDVMIFDVYGLLTDVVLDPTAYGFADSTSPCVSFLPDSPCDIPAEFVFWDGIHPTVAMHQVVAEQVIALLPVPGSWLLVILGAGVLGAVRRRPFPAAP